MKGVIVFVVSVAFLFISPQIADLEKRVIANVFAQRRIDSALLETRHWAFALVIQVEANRAKTGQIERGIANRMRYVLEKPQPRKNAANVIDKTFFQADLESGR